MDLLLIGLLALIAIVLYIAIKYENQAVFAIGIIVTVVIQGMFGGKKSCLMAAVLIFANIICLNK